MDPNLITATSTIISEPIKIIIDTWLKPKLEEFKRRRKLDKALLDDISNLFSEYLNRTYNQQKYVNVLALELQQVELDQVYIPLRIISDEKRENISIEGFNFDFVKKYRKIVIEDTAGMGKSTIMKKLFISSINSNRTIPIFIELRNLNTEKDIVNEIVDGVSSINKKFDIDLIRELIYRGDFTFFLDGYDEVSFQNKEKVTSNLLKFISKADNNFFFLTSRYDDSLSSFGQFQKFKIECLKTEEAYALLKNYDSVTKLEVAPQAIQQIKDNINGEAFRGLEFFLGNPLLVSLLYLTFRYKQDIPSSKVDFYRKVYDALYDSHDLTKCGFKRFKYSNLSSGELQKVLMRLSFLCLKENENYYSKDKLLKLIRDAKSLYNNETKEEDILKDLIETVPLMTCVGFEYRWAHKSFMEYFSALFVDDQVKKENILFDILNSNHFFIYLNMLDFYYDINRYTFDKVFIYPILKNFINYIKNNVTDFHAQLDYFENIYNKAYVIKAKRKYTTSEYVKLDLETLPQLSNYEKYSTYAINFHSAILTIDYYINNDRIIPIERILYLRKNNLIKRMKFRYNSVDLYKEVDNFEEYVSFESNININKINFSQRIEILGLGFHDECGDLCLDYSESLKYINIIEEEIKRREGNIFANL